MASDNARAKKQVPAGEAPPPPPSTWEDPYGGKTGESSGIIAILEMVKADVEKDIKTATSNEEKAKSEGDLVETKEAKDAVLLELEQLSNYNAELHQSCDFVMKNFDLRQGARSAETEALKQALTDSQTAASEEHKKALEDYTELKEAKMEQLATAQDALNKMDGENGAKAMSKEDAETERDALTTQRTNDEGFIEATANDLATKKGEWKDRQLLRAGEIEAINKAISILHSDDARDLFKSSMKSQSFLQVSAASKSSSAGAILASAAKRTCQRCAS